VRAAETACPFCASALVPTSVAAPVIAERLGRAALFAFGAAVATNAVGCGTAVAPDDGGPGDAHIGSFDAAYGTPPRDAGPPDAHMGGFDAAYGGAPHDADLVSPDGAPAQDTGVDASDDAGSDAGSDRGVHAPYGAPPAPPPPPEQL
jgi:hypothetical protein